jgi:hypothetical protein
VWAPTSAAWSALPGTVVRLTAVSSVGAEEALA